MRKITLFGATGSVGQSAIDLIARDQNSYDVVALTGGRNVAQLAADAQRLNADVAVTCYPECYAELSELLSGTGVEVAAGPGAIEEAAARPVDWALSAIVGSAGLVPGLCALKHGTKLALANKESLVTAGPLLLGTADAHNATVLPVDSEHSAVFQALVGEDMAAVERVIITASGGAFRDWPAEKLATATLAQASSHPNWDMGQRITIDSASMFNKAMELIETKEFFSVSPDMIEVLVHRESLIHAMVGFHDGALMAHVGPPDMRHAIGYALHWPDRRALPVERLDLAKIGALTFEAPDNARYPALALAKRVMQEGGLSGAIFNAAKERALDGFIAGDIGFLDMAKVVAATMDKMSSFDGLQNVEITLDSVLETDKLARVRAGEAIKTLG
ncbi:1-deoxy-D-xylulose-5-phosphate reductoisomerase [Yoonia sediminilitoris]|uniref:1-deoxy-D-xylulose 5-phosphate reductoisomerase n=1 Tax=Yoonia sediminilitoris TaxID=1286148 RepID=A0A2T6KS10_9RHOB|nr:1-deoxy-D-xylulose-5-phosphate reductoisomerase [Yoonia sediminilitoris]PUB19360.1 1-deoxy-D-xylulose 5-phosphate reductoisomerase [Yoonia sediminilitoris]RCW99528.1 1-deoxy-D-xylulose 5-phosphate reductoisomerase [Yoonia sediminilitoris]